MANFAENQNAGETPKRKRGRPRAFEPATVDDYIGYMLGNAKISKRTRDNMMYEEIATEVIFDSDCRDKLQYLWPTTQQIENGEHRRTKAILVELGRCRDPEIILNLALQVCELRLPAMEAARQIRNARRALVASE